MDARIKACPKVRSLYVEHEQIWKQKLQIDPQRRIQEIREFLSKNKGSAEIYSLIETGEWELIEPVFPCSDTESREYWRDITAFLKKIRKLVRSFCYILPTFANFSVVGIRLQKLLMYMKNVEEVKVVARLGVSDLAALGNFPTVPIEQYNKLKAYLFKNPLPNLPKLRKLEFFDEWSDREKRDQRSLLNFLMDKYASQLTCFVGTVDNWRPRDISSSTNLRSLSALEFDFGPLKSFQDFTHLRSVAEEVFVSVTFADVLIFLEKVTALRVPKLTIVISISELYTANAMYDAQSLWGNHQKRLGIISPKPNPFITHFRILLAFSLSRDVASCMSFNCLNCLPNLEHLEISYVLERDLEVKPTSIVEMFDIHEHLYKGTLYKSNVWNRLSKLQRITINQSKSLFDIDIRDASKSIEYTDVKVFTRQGFNSQTKDSLSTSKLNQEDLDKTKRLYAI